MRENVTPPKVGEIKIRPINQNDVTLVRAAIFDAINVSMKGCVQRDPFTVDTISAFSGF